MIGLAAGLNTLAQGIAALLMSPLIRHLGASRTVIGALALFSLTSAGQAIVTGRRSPRWPSSAARRPRG
jgi:hypothetical protein